MSSFATDITFRIIWGCHIPNHTGELWADPCPHADHFSRLYYIAGGNGVLEYDGRTYHLSEAMGYLFPAGRLIKHYPAPGLNHYCVHFTAHMAGGLSFFDATEWRCEKQILDRTAARLAMLRIIEDPTTPASILQQQAALQNMVQMFLGGFKRPQSEWHQRFESVLHYIDDHLETKLELSHLARLVALQSNYFSNKFTEVFGISPREHIMRKRVERAQMLLWHTRMRVGEVAAAIGHEEPAYFCRFFKQRTGLTPLTYRKQSEMSS